MGGFGGDRVAGLGRDHFGAGRGRLGGVYDDSLGCPYYRTFDSPYCNY
jgi:hypothetical protein